MRSRLFAVAQMARNRQFRENDGLPLTLSEEMAELSV
jgi:hypothetical protein